MHFNMLLKKVSYCHNFRRKFFYGKKRLEGLGIEYIYLGKDQKLPVLNEHLKKHNISLNQVLYMGDDIPDLPCLKMVGISSCPKDASVEVREVCDYISHINGGKGCVRDVLK